MRKRWTVNSLMLLFAAVTLFSCNGFPPQGLSPAASPLLAPLSIEESLVPGASSFPTDADDSTECTAVNYPYYMAKYEVTYELWKVVYDWAQANGYVLNPGQCGGGWHYTGGYEVYLENGRDSDPVTCINWYTAIVWCNSLTEYYNACNGTNLECVYKDASGNIIKNPNDSANIDYLDGLDDPNRSADGYRLPTSMEWELAARYRDGSAWTPGNYASGATDYVWNNTTDQPNTDQDPTKAVAWYNSNSVVDGDIHTSRPVGQKPNGGNALGLYDMSGNVWEYCFDKGSFSGSRSFRGGSWYDNPEETQLWIVGSGSTNGYSIRNGFRTVRTQ
jgi:formylglycine-generating enzyme